MVKLNGKAAAVPADDATVETRAGRPSRLLLTLLGDYWWRRTEQLPSAALVALLAEFGVSDVAARAALSRLVRHDLLVTSKRGRQTFYRLSDRAAHVLDDGARRIFSFGLHPRAWDGMWSVVAFSIPEESRQLRYVLRDRLRWLGFAPLYDGLWISPEEALTARTQIMDAWRGFPALDPDLPDNLLPADWPRALARRLFIEMYDELGSLAQSRVQYIIARYDPDLAKYATYHRSDVLPAFGSPGEPAQYAST